MTTLQLTLRSLLLLLVVLLFHTSSTLGQSARLHIHTDSVSVGDRFVFSVAVSHDGRNERQVSFPMTQPLQTTFGDALIVRVIGNHINYVDPGMTTARVDSIVFEATTFVLDSALVGPMTAFVTTETDSVEVLVEPEMVWVRSLVPEEAEDIKDLAPLVEFPRALWPWILAIVGLLLVLGLIWYLLKRPRGSEEVVEEAILEVPAYDEAMQRLKTLRESGSPEEPEVKDYFVELSEIVRGYFERRAGVPALELTTRELVGVLRDRVDKRMHGLPEATPIDTNELLALADLVKFADYRAGASESTAALDRAAGIVNYVEEHLVKEDRRKRMEAMGSEEVTGHRVP